VAQSISLEFVDPKAARASYQVQVRPTLAGWQPWPHGHDNICSGWQAAIKLQMRSHWSYAGRPRRENLKSSLLSHRTWPNAKHWQRRLPTWGWLSPGLAKKANEKERLKCATSLAHRAKNRRSKAELARCFCCCPTPLLHGPEIPACCWLFVLGCWLLCPVMVCRLCHERPPSTGDMFFLAEMYLMEALHWEKLFGAK